MALHEISFLSTEAGALNWIKKNFANFFFNKTSRLAKERQRCVCVTHKPGVWCLSRSGFEMYNNSVRENNDSWTDLTSSVLFESNLNHELKTHSSENCVLVF